MVKKPWLIRGEKTQSQKRHSQIASRVSGWNSSSGVTAGFQWQLVYQRPGWLTPMALCQHKLKSHYCTLQYSRAQYSAVQCHESAPEKTHKHFDNKRRVPGVSFLRSKHSCTKYPPRPYSPFGRRAGPDTGQLSPWSSTCKHEVKKTRHERFSVDSTWVKP